MNKGVRNFVIGLGGSSTNDAGFGMLEALGGCEIKIMMK
ncbi:glycerate kinase [Clostridium neonatale]